MTMNMLTSSLIWKNKLGGSILTYNIGGKSQVVLGSWGFTVDKARHFADITNMLGN